MKVAVENDDIVLNDPEEECELKPFCSKSIIRSSTVKTVMVEEEDDEEEEDEEELVDPMDKVREDCENKPSCQKYREELGTCTDRVNSRSNTEEHCTQELFDFLHCSEKCVAENLFKYLK